MVVKIRYEERECLVADGDSVLDTLLKSGIDVPHGCRAGSCQSCILKLVDGEPSAKSREGLTPLQVEQGLFLSCMCAPTEGMAMGDPSALMPRVPASIEAVERLASDVIEVRLRPHQAFEYRAGQFLNLFREDGLTRSYSIASATGVDGCIELHVRVLPRGAMSGWLSSPEAVGATVQLRGPSGACVHFPEEPDAPLVLAGTGTGLAPLLGIVKDALKHSHRGPIRLLHGASSPQGWYLQEFLQGLARGAAALEFHPCLREEADGFAALDAKLLGLASEYSGARFYLCGAPAFVQGARKKLFLSGASLRRIHADAFVVAAPP